MEQGKALMPEAKRRAYGYGSYANESMRFTSIEQYFSAIRQWLKKPAPRAPSPLRCQAAVRLPDAQRARSECAQVEGAKRPVVFTRHHWLSRSLVSVRVSETHLGLRKPLAQHFTRNEA